MFSAKNLHLSFRSQSLDNESPSHVHLVGSSVDGDHVKAYDLAYNIDLVARNGRRLGRNSKSSFVESYASNPILYNDQFTMRICTEELDNAGRRSSILCFGRVPERPPPDWRHDVMQESRAFAKDIGRTISRASDDEARRALDTILAAHSSIWNRIVRFLKKVLGCAIRQRPKDRSMRDG